ncbi:MAG: ABC transporter substrate-binding protein [Cellulosilyticaceae bacterium]
MKKFSKVIALGVTATMMGSLFVGCSSTDQTTSAPAAEKQAEATPEKKEEPAKEEPAKEEPKVENVTIKTVSMFGGTDPMAGIYKESVDKFMAANPNVKVEDSSATADEQWKSNVLTDFAAGNEPDVIFFFTDVNSKTLVEQGKVVSIEEIRKEYPDYASNILPAALDSAKCVDGNQYAVPVRGYYEGIFCNKDLFDKYNLELPTTWENLEKAITTFSENNVTPIAAALSHIPHYLIEHFILAEGGVAEHSNQDIAAVKDTWVNGLTLFKTFNDMGAFPKDAATTKHEIVQTQFANKEAAMFIDGNWAIGNMTDQENTVLVPFPGVGNGKKDPSEIIGGFSSGYYITKKAWDDPAKRDAAVKFVESMTTTELIKGFVSAAGGGSAAADIGVIDGFTPLAISGSDMAVKATAVDAAIDSWLNKAAWDYLLSKAPGIAAGKEQPTAVVDEVIRIHTGK